MSANGGIFSAVPKNLRDTHYAGSKRLGHGADYKYPHEFEGGYVKQDYLGVDRVYYEPTDRGLEAEIRRRLQSIRESRGQTPNGAPENGSDRVDK
jgi:putative ATPase